MSTDNRRTPTRPIRIPTLMWEAYGRVCERLCMTRTEDLLTHVRQRIQQHGDEQDREDLVAAEHELAERRARMHPGRPPKRQA